MTTAADGPAPNEFAPGVPLVVRDLDGELYVCRDCNFASSCPSGCMVPDRCSAEPAPRKPCSCGEADCPKLGPHGEHDWDPLADPVDSCVLCTGELDRLPGAGAYPRRAGHRLDHGPPLPPVRWGSGYAHGERV